MFTEYCIGFTKMSTVNVLKIQVMFSVATPKKIEGTLLEVDDMMIWVFP